MLAYCRDNNVLRFAVIYNVKLCFLTVCFNIFCFIVAGLIVYAVINNGSVGYLCTHEVWVVAVQKNRSAVLKSIQYFKLCGEYALTRAEIFHMRYADVCYNSRGGLYTSAQSRNLTSVIHTHLNNGGFGIFFNGEKSSRHADLVIEITLCFPGFLFAAENGANHLFCCGFAYAARKTDNRNIKPVSVP